VTDLRALRDFAIDLGLSGVAGALGWHPVFDYLSEHRRLVYWGVGGLHIGLISLIGFMALVGNTRASDLHTQRGSIHERLDTWSLVLTVCASFIVPFVCALFIGGGGNEAFAMAVLFAPFASTFGVMMLLLVLIQVRPNVTRKDIKVPNPFASVVGRTAIGAAVLAYLALQETTLFLCVASGAKASGVSAFLGFFLSYLPVRLFLFYHVTDSRQRSEVISIFLSVGFLGVQLLRAVP
jgi:hypothetical protein